VNPVELREIENIVEYELECKTWCPQMMELEELAQDFQ
jgi:hypothetical protein